MRPREGHPGRKVWNEGQSRDAKGSMFGVSAKRDRGDLGSLKSCSRFRDHWAKNCPNALNRQVSIAYFRLCFEIGKRTFIFHTATFHDHNTVRDSLRKMQILLR